MADGDWMEVEKFTVYINWRQGLGGEEGGGGCKSEGGREGGEMGRRVDIIPLTPEVSMTDWKREKTGWLARVGSMQLQARGREREMNQKMREEGAEVT